MVLDDLLVWQNDDNVARAARMAATLPYQMAGWAGQMANVGQNGRRLKDPLLRETKGRPMPRKPNFAQHIRDARIKRKLSVEVADQMGVSQSAVYLWETDRCRPRDANLSALSKVLKLPVRATKAMAAA